MIDIAVLTAIRGEKEQYVVLHREAGDVPVLREDDCQV